LSPEMDNINYFLKNLFIQIKPPNTYKPSFVWNYFGRLYKKPNEAIDLEKFYCKICFDKFKSEEPDTVFSSVQKQIGVYSATSATGNMKSHLLAIHRISEPQQTKTTSQHILSMFSRDHHSQKASQLKQQLGHQLALMCCRDLLPFSIVENEGFQDFLICNKIVNSKEDIPSRTILSPINLNKIYDVCVERTNEQLKSASPFPTITSDIWCNKYKHRSYICFTIHYLDSNVHLHKYSLKTEPFDGRHTGEAIKDRFLTVLNEFNLSSNNIIVISDKGSNMRKAWKLLKIIHMFCIGHGIHNLLMVDCFPRLTGIPDLLDKVQKIINKLRYRRHELEQEFIRIHDQIKNDLFEVINKAGEVLDADLALSYDDIEDVDQLDHEKENYELELYSINDQRSSKFDYLKKQIQLLIILMSFIL
ncbi:unnamed protein product, partial [Rotaria sordida]